MEQRGRGKHDTIVHFPLRVGRGGQHLTGAGRDGLQPFRLSRDGLQQTIQYFTPKPHGPYSLNCPSPTAALSQKGDLESSHVLKGLIDSRRLIPFVACHEIRISLVSSRLFGTVQGTVATVCML
ncbi:hypothetical protein J6590_077974 [Homalodisca vitripennis]|nr:hypothetical protein J6590_077974 [Homalodisca vitripennis]